MNLHRVNQFFHQLVVAVSLGAGLFVAILSVMATAPRTVYADGTFGGLVIAVVPETKTCPRHMVVADYGNNGNPIGVYSLVTTTVYSNYNLYQIGKYLLGSHSSVFFVTCTTPYKVYPLTMVGTS